MVALTLSRNTKDNLEMGKEQVMRLEGDFAQPQTEDRRDMAVGEDKVSTVNIPQLSMVASSPPLMKVSWAFRNSLTIGTEST